MKSPLVLLELHMPHIFCCFKDASTQEKKNIKMLTARKRLTNFPPPYSCMVALMQPGRQETWTSCTCNSPSTLLANACLKITCELTNIIPSQPYLKLRPCVVNYAILLKISCIQHERALYTHTFLWEKTNCFLQTATMISTTVCYMGAICNSVHLMWTRKQQTEDIFFSRVDPTHTAISS